MNNINDGTTLHTQYIIGSIYKQKMGKNSLCDFSSKDKFLQLFSEIQKFYFYDRIRIYESISTIFFFAGDNIKKKKKNYYIFNKGLKFIDFSNFFFFKVFPQKFIKIWDLFLISQKYFSN